MNLATRTLPPNLTVLSFGQAQQGWHALQTRATELALLVVLAEWHVM